ncbi:glyceraldehyde-3-phosphate dehydrogenase [Tanacetum coccineum]
MVCTLRPPSELLSMTLPAVKIRNFYEAPTQTFKLFIVFQLHIAMFGYVDVDVTIFRHSKGHQLLEFLLIVERFQRLKIENVMRLSEKFCGKPTVMAFHVPIVDVSVVDLTDWLKKSASYDDINQLALQGHATCRKDKGDGGHSNQHFIANGSLILCVGVLGKVCLSVPVLECDCDCGVQ